MQIKHRIQLVDLLRYLELPLIGIECGVAEANYSRDLLKEGMDKLYSIDNWAEIKGQRGDGGFPDEEFHIPNYESAKLKLAPFGEKSVMLRGLSYEMAKHIPDESVGLVYIDCDHSYEGCKRDIEAFYPKLVPFGVMAFHDYENDAYGVKEAVTEFAQRKGLPVYSIPENDPVNAGAWFQKL